MPINVYRARDSKNGNTVYFVGRYSESDGRYVRSLTAGERRLTGCNAEFGSLSYVGCQYDNESSARSAARRRDGYSKIENAYGNLGDRYERI